MQQIDINLVAENNIPSFSYSFCELGSAVQGPAGAGLSSEPQGPFHTHVLVDGID